jgi:orotate phosphoribosyltransferase
LVRERAFGDGLDIVLASGKRSTFYINGKAVTLHPEGLWLMARLMLEELRRLPEVTAVGGLTLGADPMAAAICALSHETGQHLDAFARGVWGAPALKSSIAGEPCPARASHAD